MSWAVLGMFFYAIASAWLAALIKPIFDNVLPNQERLGFMAWAIVLLYLLKGAGSYVSSYLMENYLAAADRALDAAIANGARPQTIKRRFDIKEEKTVKPTGSVYRHVDDGVAIFSSWVSANIQVTLWNFRSRERGDYRFRISGYGYQTKKPVTFHVVAGTLTAVTEERLLDYYSVPPEKPTVIEFVEHLESRNCIRIVADALGALPPEVQKVGAENYKGPGLVVQWVEIEGPLVNSLTLALNAAVILVPLSLVLGVLAVTGNPLGARAVRTIVFAGLVVSWVSGAILAERVALRRALAHALCAVLAVGAVTYLAVDDGHLIDFVLETWRAGHERG